MKVLVTGGAGFIGSTLIRALVREGHSVINVDALTYAADLRGTEIVAQSENYILEKIDIRSLVDVTRVITNHKPDSVVHLAAESHVDRSIDSPLAFIETNVLGTANLLEASRNYWNSIGKPSSFRFHHVSTDEVFGSLALNSFDRFVESTPYAPRSPYAASKASSDHLVRAWNHTYGLPIVVSNCSNNYGPYQFPEKLIPLVVLRCVTGSSVPVYGDGSNVRDWLFVEDHANALITVMRRGRVGCSYNIGGGSELSNLNIVRKICDILDRLRPLRSGDSYHKLITFVEDRPGHDKRYSVEFSLLQNELGWSPSINIDDGLELTVSWYLDNLSYYISEDGTEIFHQRLGTSV